MLTFRQLDDAGDAAVKIIADTEQAIINDMARRIARLDSVTAATNWQAMRLELLGTGQDTILRELSRALNMAEQRIIEMFDEAATRAIAADNQMFKAAGYDPIPLADNPQLQQILRAGLTKTLDTYKNLTLTTANTATHQFEQALDLAYQKIASGAFSYQQAVSAGIRTLTQNGIASIIYPTGRVDYLDVAFRRAALTGINQTAAEIQLTNMSQVGTDLVETTAHHGARPSHAIWQGRVFSVSGTHPQYPNFYTATGYGTGAGLCGWNCRHSFFPYFDGLSSPAYSADKLREYNAKKVEYNGDIMSLYDATQRQRYIERQIRRWKREESALEAAGLDNGMAREKVRQWQAAQRDFIRQTGLSRDYFRERAGRQFTSGGISGKINVNSSERSNMRTLPNASNAAIPEEKFTEYALNPYRDSNKAQAFQSALGYNLTNADELIANIRANISRFPAVEKPDNGFGRRYEVLMTLTGANGRQANVKTAWIMDYNTGEIRLTSAYITKKRLNEV